MAAGHEVMPERVHLDDGRHAGGIAIIKGIHSLGERGRGVRFHSQQAGLAPFFKFSRRKGKAIPEKLEPPPTQPMTTSGYSPAMSICLRTSSPITVWCSSTWCSTEPRPYFFAPLETAATSTASEMAIPSEPGFSGSSAQHLAPVLCQLLGLAEHLRAVGFHQIAPVRFLLIRDFDHVDFQVQDRRTGMPWKARNPTALRRSRWSWLWCRRFCCKKPGGWPYWICGFPTGKHLRT